jgi:hypothetical protein
MRSRAALFLSDTRGAIALLFALAAIPMIAMTGIAIDYGNASRMRSQLQNSIDAAVLSGVTETGREVATAERHLNGAFHLPVDGAFTLERPGRLVGTARADIDTSLMRVLGIPTIKVAATATAIAGSNRRICVLVLDPSGSQAFLVNSGFRMVAPDCEIHVHSTAKPAAIFNAGSRLEQKRVCVRGSNVIRNGGAPIDNLELNCDAVADPFAGQLPAPPATACSITGRDYVGNVHLTPGVYCGWFNFNSGPTVTFAPGVYVIRNGGWNVNGGTWTGNGVTFHFADTSKIQFNSGMSVDLSAPTTGDHAGILMYEAESLAPSDFIFNNAMRNDMDGLIWLPSRNVTFNSGSQLRASNLTFVMRRLIVNSGSRWDVAPNPQRFITEGQGEVRLVN